MIDYFEEYSKKVKQEKLIIYDTLRDIYIPPAQLESAKNQLLLLNVSMVPAVVKSSYYSEYFCFITDPRRQMSTITLF